MSAQELETGKLYRVTTKEGYKLKVKVLDPPKQIPVKPGMVWIEKQPSDRRRYSKTAGLYAASKGWTDPTKYEWKEVKR